MSNVEMNGSFLKVQRVYLVIVKQPLFTLL